MTNRPVSPGEARVELARLLRDSADEVLRSPLPIWIREAGNSFEGCTDLERRQVEALRLLVEATTAVSHLAAGLAHTGDDGLGRQFLRWGAMALQAPSISHLSVCPTHHTGNTHHGAGEAT